MDVGFPLHAGIAQWSREQADMEKLVARKSSARSSSWIRLMKTSWWTAAWCSKRMSAGKAEGVRGLKEGAWWRHGPHGHRFGRLWTLAAWMPAACGRHVLGTIAKPSML